MIFPNPERAVRSARTAAYAAAGLVAVVAISSCTQNPAATNGSGNFEPGSSTEAPTPSSEPAATISANIQQGSKDAKIGVRVEVNVTDGQLEKVKFSDQEQQLSGKMVDAGERWVATSRTLPGRHYKLRAVAVDESGLRTNYGSKFSTPDIAKSAQTYPSFYPTEGATVGVGMPITIRFDVPVERKDLFERNIEVTTIPRQSGAFRWMSDYSLHWRPKNYWKPGTKISVKANVGGLHAGNGVYGQLDRTLNFNIGRSMISKVDAVAHTMKVYRDGKLLRTLPITTGEQPKFTTRSGVKVITEKHRYKNMNSETIGIDPESADGYDLEDVEYALRITSSGEFLHAAPWSVGSQGSANVSHGCTGMSTANAGWFYNLTTVGDVVEYTGTDRPMTLTNGYGDWNLPFKEYSNG